jgi:hypothetical protein
LLSIQRMCSISQTNFNSEIVNFTLSKEICLILDFYFGRYHNYANPF